MTILHYLKERREGIALDHENMVKFTGIDDGNYKKALKELRRMGTSAVDGM